MKETLITAYRSLIKQKVRTILTILTISIGISAIIMIFSAGDGLESYVQSEIDSFGGDTLEIEVKVPNTGKTSSENAMGIAQGITITTLKDEDIEAIRRHPNIDKIYGGMMGQELVSYRDELKKIFLFGTGFEAQEVSKLTVEQGSFYTQEDEKTLARVVVLGYGVWQDLFGDEDPIGKSIKIKNMKFRVIGVMEEKGSAFFMSFDDMIYIPVTTLQKRILGVDYVSYALASMIDPDKGEQTQQELTEIMREQHNITDPNKDDFHVTTMKEAKEIMDSVIGAITTLLVALVCISLVVGGVGIMNIMYVSVAERTFEIGLRKALGATSANILTQFLFEALLVTIGGGVIGIIIGAVLSYLVKVAAAGYGLAWTYQISIFSIIVAVGFSVAIGLLFGIYPAKKAASLDPIQALRKE